MVALASCFAFPGEFLLQASKRLAPPLGGHARSPIRRANNRLRSSAGSPGHRRIPPVAVFALRDVRAGFMFAAQAVFCACLGLLFRLPRRVPFASVQKEPKDSPRHPAPAASRLGCPRCIVAPGGTPPRSFVDRGGSRGILPLVPLRNDSARPPDGAGLPPHHLEGKPHFVDARNPIRRADTAYGGIRPTGLHGNERRRLAVLLFLEFLSCLYGSEQASTGGPCTANFLSCLYGSERIDQGSTVVVDFLSCLYGSELADSHDRSPRRFLSCLYGSEHQRGQVVAFRRFLSCLYGSEHEPRRVQRQAQFLSCLYGSERPAAAE